MTDPTLQMTLTPYLNVDGAAQAIDFYKDAFGAEEIMRLTDPNDGRIGHAELQLGTTSLMISDEYPDFGAMGPAAFGGTPVKMVLTVANADDTYARALAHGAVSLRGLRDEFHGYRSGQVADPFGHVWFIQSKSKDLLTVEMQAQWDQSAAE